MFSVTPASLLTEQPIEGVDMRSVHQGTRRPKPQAALPISRVALSGQIREGLPERSPASAGRPHGDERGPVRSGSRWLTRPAALLLVLISSTSSATAAHFRNDISTRTLAPDWRRGVVAADHPAASDAGLIILKQGGNVVDAAVATSFALSVVRPASCGIGGGGFMVIWLADEQRAVAIDYRERAPAAAERDMFSGDAGARRSSVRGGAAVAIPGTVAGLCEAHRQFGRLPLKQVLAPAIRLAEGGIAPDAHDVSVQRITLERMSEHPDLRDEITRGYLNNGEPWKATDRFRSPQLPALQAIAEHGPQAFYRGLMADAIVRRVRDVGGILTKADLAGYQPTIREVLSQPWNNRQVLTMPPPSSGGIAIHQMLATLAAWESQSGRSLQELGHNSGEYIHVVTEAMKHAFADRAEFLGDADYVDVPVKKLISSDYAALLAKKIRVDRTLPREAYGRFQGTDDSGTSHFSVMDAEGNAVACTETINLTFGSCVVVPEWGIVLNDEMDDFAARPGQANAFGLLQSEANAIAPGKRPLSSMSPTIVVNPEGHAELAIGASGGPRIITGTMQVFLNVLEFGMPIQDAVNAPRFHHQWSPHVLRMENELHRRAVTELSGRGHECEVIDRVGIVQGAQRLGSAPEQVRLQGASDPAKHGHPAGW